MLATEATALFALAAALAAGAGGDGPSFAIVLAAMAGGFGLVRLLQRFELSVRAQVATGAALSVIGLMVLINLQYEPAHNPLSLAWLLELAGDPQWFGAGRWAAAWGVAVLIVAWFRGVYAAQRQLTYTEALASYTAGLILLVVLLIFGQASSAARAIDLAALPYFMLGLLTLSLINLSRAEFQQGDLLRGPWLVTLLGTVGLLALISGIIGLFPLGLLNTVLAPVGDLVLRILDFIILIIALPVAYIVSWALQALTGGRPLQWPELNNIASDGMERLQEAADHGGPPQLIAFLVKSVFLLLLFAAVGAVLWRVFRRVRRPLPVTDETRESIAAEGGLGQDLGALLGGLFGRFRRPTHDDEPSLPADVLAVRRAYLAGAPPGGVQGPPGRRPPHRRSSRPRSPMPWPRPRPCRSAVPSPPRATARGRRRRTSLPRWSARPCAAAEARAGALAQAHDVGGPSQTQLLACPAGPMRAGHRPPDSAGNQTHITRPRTVRWATAEQIMRRLMAEAAAGAVAQDSRPVRDRAARASDSHSASGRPKTPVAIRA
ncbi:MAG: hypothetical protein U0531_02920 [Dehalococcoidia bacterium]